MRKVVLAAAMFSLVGCGVASTRHGGGGGSGTGGGSGSGNGGNGSGGGTNPQCAQTDPNKDGDGDGFTVGQGDCDDCDPSVNPGAVNIPGDSKSYDCGAGNNAACDATADERKHCCREHDLAHPEPPTDRSYVSDAHHTVGASVTLALPRGPRTKSRATTGTKRSCMER